MTNRNRLWDVIQAYMDDPGHRYPPKVADLARETGVSDQVISKWKSKPMLPTKEQLAKFSRGTGIGYLELLVSALVGKGYLPDAPDIELEINGSFRPEDEMGFMAGVSPPSGWAGTKLLGTQERGAPVTPLRPSTGDPATSEPEERAALDDPEDPPGTSHE